MALPISEWLSFNFMEKILRKSEVDDSLQVINVVSKEATNKGDNYCSDLIRVNVEFSRNHSDSNITEIKSIIIKIAPVIEGPRRDMIIQAGLFPTEISMMTNTLNKMNKLLEPEHRLSPKDLYVQESDPMFLVIEDLTSFDFRMNSDREAGFDLDHCILAMRLLARFHAATVAVCEEEPEQKKMYFKGLFSDTYVPETRLLFIMGCKALAEEIKNWPELEKYSEKIAKLSDGIFQMGIDMSKPSENEFNVINHGDCWVNNIMFKYNDDGKPIDQIFIDFQLSIYGSPALDLHYFLNTSPSVDVSENKIDVLLNEYLDTLSSTMKRLDCKTNSPTMEELKAALLRKTAYGMIATFTVLPILMCKKDEVKGFDDMLNTNRTQTNRYKNEIYRKLIGKRIPMYDELGLLDL